MTDPAALTQALATLANAHADWLVETGGPDHHAPAERALHEAVRAALAGAAPPEPPGCEHVWGIDGAHSNEYCKRCFVSRPQGAPEGVAPSTPPPDVIREEDYWNMMCGYCHHPRKDCDHADLWEDGIHVRGGRRADEGAGNG